MRFDYNNLKQNWDYYNTHKTETESTNVLTALINMVWCDFRFLLVSTNETILNFLKPYQFSNETKILFVLSLVIIILLLWRLAQRQLMKKLIFNFLCLTVSFLLIIFYYLEIENSTINSFYTLSSIQIYNYIFNIFLFIFKFSWDVSFLETLKFTKQCLITTNINTYVIIFNNFNLKNNFFFYTAIILIIFAANLYNIETISEKQKQKLKNYENFILLLLFYLMLQFTDNNCFNYLSIYFLQKIIIYLCVKSKKKIQISDIIELPDRFSFLLFIFFFLDILKALNNTSLLLEICAILIVSVNYSKFFFFLESYTHKTPSTFLIVKYSLFYPMFIMLYANYFFYLKPIFFLASVFLLFLPFAKDFFNYFLTIPLRAKFREKRITMFEGLSDAIKNELYEESWKYNDHCFVIVSKFYFCVYMTVCCGALIFEGNKSFIYLYIIFMSFFINIFVHTVLFALQETKTTGSILDLRGASLCCYQFEYLGNYILIALVNTYLFIFSLFILLIIQSFLKFSIVLLFLLLFILFFYKYMIYPLKRNFIHWVEFVGYEQDTEFESWTEDFWKQMSPFLRDYLFWKPIVNDYSGVLKLPYYFGMKYKNSYNTPLIYNFTFFIFFIITEYSGVINTKDEYLFYFLKLMFIILIIVTYREVYWDIENSEVISEQKYIYLTFRVNMLELISLVIIILITYKYILPDIDDIINYVLKLTKSIKKNLVWVYEKINKIYNFIVGNKSHDRNAGVIRDCRPEFRKRRLEYEALLERLRQRELMYERIREERRWKRHITIFDIADKINKYRNSR